jgi:hypothetical protein
MTAMNHPGERDLALLAGGDAGRLQRFLLERHLHHCPACRGKISEYRELRSELASIDIPDVNWNFLAADMRANIRLGLEAGACVRETQITHRWNPRLVMAFASLLVILFAGGELLRSGKFPHYPSRAGLASDAAPVLESTGSGVEIRTGSNSLMLLNHDGDPSSQTVRANGDIGEGFVDGETGTVTMNNVYLQ